MLLQHSKDQWGATMNRINRAATTGTFYSIATTCFKEIFNMKYSYNDFKIIPAV